MTESALDQDWQAAGFGLYIHWPFCQSKCPYCDFNSHVSTQIDQEAWRTGYLREIERVAALTGDRVLSTIYFGGGTPSLMPPQTTAAILDKIQQSWRFRNDLEITLEANPTSVEAARLRAYKDAGVNRISLGIQALNDTDLRRLGRMHSCDEARRALHLTASTFDRYSFDLIYARQFQTLDEWELELSQALSFGSDHISLYQLTVEDGTVFGERHRKGQLLGLPNDDLGADFYDLTQDLTEAAGLPAYEVSNHAKSGSESRHNMIYWGSGDYAGIGPGAHGRLTLDGTRFSTAAPSAPNSWLHQALVGEVNDKPTSLASSERATEFLLMGLRLHQGISLSRFQIHAGRELPAEAIDDLIDLDMIEVTEDRMATTAKGRPLLNAILLRLIAAL